MGLAAVSSLVTRDVPTPDQVTTAVADEDIQSSTPIAVMAPSVVIIQSLIPLPLSDGKAAHPGDAVTFQPIETRCGVDRVLEWCKPGGQYCAITLSLSGRGVGDAVLKAEDQAIYPIDKTLKGYRGSFFLDSQGIPVRDVTVGEADNFREVLVVDSPAGFSPAVAFLRESAIADPL